MNVTVIAICLFWRFNNLPFCHFRDLGCQSIKVSLILCLFLTSLCPTGCRLSCCDRQHHMIKQANMKNPQRGQFGITSHPSKQISFRLPVKLCFLGHFLEPSWNHVLTLRALSFYFSISCLSATMFVCSVYCRWQVVATAYNRQISCGTREWHLCWSRETSGIIVFL